MHASSLTKIYSIVIAPQLKRSAKSYTYKFSKPDLPSKNKNVVTGAKIDLKLMMQRDSRLLQ